MLNRPGEYLGYACLSFEVLEYSGNNPNLDHHGFAVTMQTCILRSVVKGSGRVHMVVVFMQACWHICMP